MIDDFTSLPVSVYHGISRLLTLCKAFGQGILDTKTVEGSEAIGTQSYTCADFFKLWCSLVDLDVDIGVFEECDCCDETSDATTSDRYLELKRVLLS
jgi:hypothetical protein